MSRCPGCATGRWCPSSWSRISEQLELLDERGQVDEIVNTHQELALLTAAVARLPARCRQVFTLRKVYGLIAEGNRGGAQDLREHRRAAPGQGRAPVQRRAGDFADGRAPLALVRTRAPPRRNVSERRTHRAAGQPLAGAARRRRGCRTGAGVRTAGSRRTSAIASPTSGSKRPGDAAIDCAICVRWIAASIPTCCVRRAATGRWPLPRAWCWHCWSAGLFFAESQLGWQRYETRIGGFSRIVLDDGSVIDLNTDSEVRVRVGSHKREVRLVRGEGRFQVAHDATRPFTVSAADADVRAVGTAFSVRLHDSKQVDVLVSEGTVAIAAARVTHAPPVHAGEAAVVLPDRVSVSRIEPQQLERRLAWTSGRLQFRGESLARGRQRIQSLQPPAIEARAMPHSPQLRVGGTFNATDPESFAAALASAFNLQVDPDRIQTPSSFDLREPGRSSGLGAACRLDGVHITHAVICARAWCSWLLLALPALAARAQDCDLRVPHLRAGRGRRPGRVRCAVANAVAVRLRGRAGDPHAAARGTHDRRSGAQPAACPAAASRSKSSTTAPSASMRDRGRQDAATRACRADARRKMRLGNSQRRRRAVEEIIVTAEKRDQALQRSALAVTALPSRVARTPAGHRSQERDHADPQSADRAQLHAGGVRPRACAASSRPIAPRSATRPWRSTSTASIRRARRARPC